MGFVRILRQLALLSLPHCLRCCLTCFLAQAEAAFIIAQYRSSGGPKGGSNLHYLPNVTDNSNDHTGYTVSHQSLPSGTLVRLLNDCNGRPSLAFPRASSWQHSLSCGVRLEQIEPHTNRRRFQLRLFSTTDFPEVTGAALWGHEVSGRIADILVVFWSAMCLTKKETCTCNKQGGCPINCQNQGRPSCLASIYGGKLFPLGTRLCQGTRSIENKSEDEGCYFYSLEPEDGWGCGKDSSERTRNPNIVGALTPLLKKPGSRSDSATDNWGRHGIRLGSSPRVRYGTLFVAKFDGHGRRQWVKPLANDAALFFGDAPAVMVEGGEIPVAGGIVEKHYAVTVTRERWVSKLGKTVVFPHCEIVFVKANGDWGEADLPGKKCESCQYSSAALHPVTHTWASLCVNTTIPNLGIQINGLLAVDSTQRYKEDRVDMKTLSPQLSYLKDTSGRLIPAGEGSWVLIWKEASWRVSQTEGLTATTAIVKAAVWHQKQGYSSTLGEPTSLIGPLMELRLRNVNAVALSHEFALVTAIDQLSGKALIAAVDLSEVSKKGSVGKVDIAMRNGPLFGNLQRRVPVPLQSDVALLLEASTRSRLLHGNARQLLDTPQAIPVTKNETREDCEGRRNKMPLISLQVGTLELRVLLLVFATTDFPKHHQYQGMSLGSH
ncbi:hypothetical protein Emag_005875 [Eimeria magna]